MQTKKVRCRKRIEVSEWNCTMRARVEEREGIRHVEPATQFDQ